jgi:deoxyribodipyrimidine photo-lyase
MKTIIVWYRNDLRIHDHPALATAALDADHVIPVFILNDDLLRSDRASSNRNRFLLQCLADLKNSLQGLGADLVIRHGDAVQELQKLIDETAAEAVYYSADFSAYAIKRDKTVKNALSVSFRAFPGRLAVSSLDKLLTKTGTTYKVFTPFWKNWQQIGRREIAALPTRLSPLSGVAVGILPDVSDYTTSCPLSPDALPGGETEARQQLTNWLTDGIESYHETSNDLAANGTSRLSSYLHFGCLSAREIETMLPDSVGANAWHRQLAWREFYHYIIFKFPRNTTEEFQERYRSLVWSKNPELLKAWETGTTGYPVVDAAMRQLLQEGWMHNRARLIVGSFLTKDLWLDWRLGERHFMRMLIDGDQANNNGNWQWIASVGVDPAPVFRRLYNPTTQQLNYDPSGAYVRRYLPELAKVPDQYLAEPWKMPLGLQRHCGCVIGKDYPAPIVDHKQARLEALEHYRAVTPTADLD